MCRYVRLLGIEDGLASCVRPYAPLCAGSWGSFNCVASVRWMEHRLRVNTLRTGDMPELLRADVVRLCVEAHLEPDFMRLFSYLPTDGLHVLAWDGTDLVGHAIITTRWLQIADAPLLRTAYVDAVSTRPGHQGRGVGTAVMKQVEAEAGSWEIACLETERASFYARLGWVEWKGPLAGRTAEGLIPTPHQTGIMVLVLPHTPPMRLDESLTIEADQRLW